MASALGLGFGLRRSVRDGGACEAAPASLFGGEGGGVALSSLIGRS